MLEEIPGFPQYLMDRHMNWHANAGHPEQGGRAILQGQPGSGAEFLDFHHQYLIDFKTWYDMQDGHDDGKIAPWTELPPDLVSAHPMLAEFQQTAGDGSSFATEDALGLYIEPTHNSVHGWIAQLYDEPGFGGYDSCMYFMFYQWHGIIDHWRNHWQMTHGRMKHVIAEHPISVKVLVDSMLPDLRAKEHRDVLIASPHLGPIPEGGVAHLASRVGALEAKVATQEAFIRKAERPAVD